MENNITEFLEKYDYDVRKSGDARWIDQKCTPDVVSFVADCVLKYVEKFGDVEFTTRNIWDFEYADKTIREIFRKPSTQSVLSQNEYDKFFSQPLKLLSYSHLLDEEKRGTRNYYRLNNIEILKYISIREVNALNFIYLYSLKVLKDSDLWNDFEMFFENQTQSHYHQLKTKFENFTIKYTNINGIKDVRRIFTKIINPIAFKLNKKGTSRGRISKHSINYDELMYNRANFRDVWNEKPKDKTREEWLEEVGKNANKAYYQYQSAKAKTFLREYNETYRQGKSEFIDEYSNGLATQIHHIFPESEFPTISAYLENLIALTPTQHYNKAHPNNNTHLIDLQYQELLLKAKASIIEENLKTNNIIYSFQNFGTVLNTGFYIEDFFEINNYGSAMILIDNFYNHR